MRTFRIFALFIMVFGLALNPAKALDSQDERAIKQVITDQIEAFRQDDATKAFSYAAPSIKQKFTSPDMFMSMVRRGYDPVYRPTAYDFGKLVKVHGMLIQEVFLTDRKGVPTIALYTMQKQPEGDWRISAVRLHQPEGQNA
ncbi:MAG: DUF4864 domain-containing protein [Alphaproteobacteria bacterium]|nr:DUF4864 domain-containing protein [Alphaproteobacteria bacterium]